MKKVTPRELAALVIIVALVIIGLCGTLSGVIPPTPVAF